MMRFRSRQLGKGQRHNSIEIALRIANRLSYCFSCCKDVDVSHRTKDERCSGATLALSDVSIVAGLFIASVSLLSRFSQRQITPLVDVWLLQDKPHAAERKKNAPSLKKRRAPCFVSLCLSLSCLFSVSACVSPPGV